MVIRPDTSKRSKIKEVGGQVMYSWSVASMKKSILFDVLNVVDGACRINSARDSWKEFSLLKKDTFDKYNRIFELARHYDDSIAAALYIPESESMDDDYTALFKGLVFNKAINFSSFDDLLTFIQNLDREVGSEYIMKHCLCMEHKIIPEDFIPIMIRSKDMLSISMLNDTNLPKLVKYSLTTLIFNYNEFLNKLISYLEKIYQEVVSIYFKYKEKYRYSSKLLKEYLKNNNAENLLLYDTQKLLLQNDMSRKYIVILSLLRLEYSLMTYDNNKALFIEGLFSIQRILHDINFKIF